MIILRRRWLPLAVALVSFLSAQQAEAAGLLSLPFCVGNCVQKASTCRATDTKCLCRATREDDKFLPTVAACIRDECESSLSLGTLLIPLRTSCLLFGLPIPNSAIRNGNAVLKEPPSSSTTKSASASASTTTAKATDTSTSSSTTLRTTTAIPSAPPLTTASPVSSPTTTTAAPAPATTSTSTSASPEAPAGTPLTTTPLSSSSPVVDGSKGDKLQTDPFAAPEKSGASSRTGRHVPLLTSALVSSTAAIMLVWGWN
ncbi:hypothetical protein PG996_002323 [Apiospora saccharicola]|uniref:CFEM domain-containing protein n=1 Tax=Apiospora saccharicola TaxID=335842 RepID=A0ABR1WKL2_9PEZI